MGRTVAITIFFILVSCLFFVSYAKGTHLWSFTTGNDIRSTPVIENGILYTGSLDGHIFALASKTGKQLWKYLHWPNQYFSCFGWWYTLC